LSRQRKSIGNPNDAFKEECAIDIWTTEVWKDIPGYVGEYQVSNLGNVKSLERKILKSNGVVSTIRERVLRQNTVNGYPYVNLGNGNSKKVHVLVALAFLGERPDGMDVRHKDGNKSNNNVDNLEYGTRSENNLDNYKHYGYFCKTQKLNREKAKEIKNLIQQGVPLKKIASQYDVARSTISAIKRGDLYAEVGDTT